jgi:hypothetical protein
MWRRGMVSRGRHRERDVSDEARSVHVVSAAQRKVGSEGLSWRKLELEIVLG